MTATQTQALEALCADAPWYEKLIVKHRRLMGVAIPFTFFQVIWWSCAVKYNFWRLFPDRFFMSITMIFGSMIAGKKEVILRIETLEIFSNEVFGIYCKPQFFTRDLQNFPRLRIGKHCGSRGNKSHSFLWDKPLSV